jgi:hypothetical protein
MLGKEMSINKMIPEKHVWVFNSGSKGFPGGVFTERAMAELWIETHRLSGVLTAYPLDEGCYDFAIRHELISRRSLEKHQGDPEFIGSFSSASLTHYHYENGICDFA